MNDELSKLIKTALNELQLEEVDFVLEHPNDLSNGDYATNVAMILAKKQGTNPKELAEKIVAQLNTSKTKDIEKIEVAGPGFINFHLSSQFFSTSISDAINKNESFGTNKDLEGQHIMYEYTDPNPFKVLHIGHLMSNSIGEALARLAQANGADVRRVNYQGDVGLHVAKAVWGMKQNLASLPPESASLAQKARFLGQSYAFGNKEYEDNPDAQQEIVAYNKALFKKSDDELNALYKKGREWSLASFEMVYLVLGTSFDHYFFESDVFEDGLKIVDEGLRKGVFEESEGAIVYKGEKNGLHTRVFLNQHKLPTYEAKDLGLAEKKKEMWKEMTKSVIITAQEQKEYMRVVQSALKEIDPDLANKTEHITHGFLRLSGGKMSSRKGTIIAAEDLLRDVATKVIEKMNDEEDVDPTEMLSQTTTAMTVSVAAVKYAILKQSIGKDIIFDFDKSLSFEGDSGPYLQYTHTRALSILNKAQEQSLAADAMSKPSTWQTTTIEKLVYQFPEIVRESYKENAPHKLTNYLIEVASAFNSFYASKKIIDKDDSSTGYRLAITRSVQTVLNNGLAMLGIGAPEKM